VCHAHGMRLLHLAPVGHSFDARGGVCVAAVAGGAAQEAQREGGRRIQGEPPRRVRSGGCGGGRV